MDSDPNFRSKYYKNVGIVNPSPEHKAQQPNGLLLEADGFDLNGNQPRKHRCEYCTFNSIIFICPSCVKKRVEGLRKQLEHFEFDRDEKMLLVEELVSKLMKLNEKKERQRRLDKKLKRLGLLRELVERERKNLRRDQTALCTKKQNFEKRIKTLELNQRESRDKFDSVKHRVPEVTRKVNSNLKVRRETLRGVFRHTVKELDKLYPIRKINTRFYSIAKLPLPARMTPDNISRKAVEAMNQHLYLKPNVILRKTENAIPLHVPIFAGLGYVVLVCQLLSSYLNCSLPFKMKFRGCHSYVEDHSKVRYGLHIPRHRSDMHEDDQFQRVFANEDDQLKHVHRAIKLLDHNIRHLCIHFNMDPNRLHSLALLPNLFQLCDYLRGDTLGNSDSRIIESIQDREIFHPFPSVGSNYFLKNQEPASDEESDDEDFVDDFVVTTI